MTSACQPPPTDPLFASSHLKSRPKPSDVFSLLLSTEKPTMPAKMNRWKRIKTTPKTWKKEISIWADKIDPNLIKTHLNVYQAMYEEDWTKNKRKSMQCKGVLLKERGIFVWPATNRPGGHEQNWWELVVYCRQPTWLRARATWTYRRFYYKTKNDFIITSTYGDFRADK